MTFKRRQTVGMSIGSPTENPGRRPPIELEAGQIWEAPTALKRKNRFRHIVWCGRPPEALRGIIGSAPTVGYVADPTAAHFPTTGHDSYVNIEGFRAWIRKYGAQLITAEQYEEAKPAMTSVKRAASRMR